jgi:lysophospholipase L1-like esterase
MNMIMGWPMLPKAGTSPRLTTVARLALVTIVLFPVVVLGLYAWFWLKSHVPDRVYWNGVLFFLGVFEAVYLAAVTVAAAGTLLLGWLVFGARRTRQGVRLIARGLLLCVSILLGALFAEGAAAFWQYRAHRFSAMPAGGLRRDRASRDESRFRAPTADFPLRTDFTDPPGDDDIDLVILGESSAEGVPFSTWLSIGSIIEWKLSLAIPGRRIRSRVLARSGDTLEWQHRELANLPRRPDILIIFCGHNEFSSRMADSRDVDHYFDERLPTTWNILLNRTERLSPLCGLIVETKEKCTLALPPSGARRRLVDVPVYNPSEFITLVVDFRRRLERIVAYAEQVGALPILVLPAANDSRFEPNRSFLPARTSSREREAFQREFQAARRVESSDPDAAITRYRSLLAEQPGFAEASYRLARLLEQSGAWGEAYRLYVDARDQDGYPIRSPSAFQEAYRSVAKRHDCILVDTQSYFHEIGRHGLLDDELFQDAMHPSLRGQLALAQAILQAIHARGAFGWPRNSSVPVLDPAECAARFRLDAAAWRVICLWSIKFNSLAAPLRYDPVERNQEKLRYADAADRIAAGQAPEALGLANLGIPAPIPTVPDSSGRSSAQ